MTTEKGREAESGVATGAAEPVLEEVLEALTRTPREISPKFFYDERGSALFEEITRLDEYYPTRVEETLLHSCAPGWIERLRPATLVELGAGSARKSRILLDRMAELGCGEAFIPIDVSEEFLRETARALRAEYPGLRIAPEIRDIEEPLDLPGLSGGVAIFALLGGTIGNFPGEEAVRLLRRVRRALRPEDRFIVGVDLRPSDAKPVEALEAAYNDKRGVTAAFNLNALHVLNERLGADFDPSAFEHEAFYDEEAGRIEMHLRSLRDQMVTFPEAPPIRIGQGERIRTEISCKYDRPTFEGQLAAAGLRLEAWCEDPERRFALVLVAP